jgi:integrase
MDNANLYGSAELQGIIDLLVVPKVVNGKPVWEKPSNYWIPLIGMFSGLRKTEITQLHKSNFINLDGIPCVQVDDAIKGQSLKSALRKRIVPIHPKLIELGILEYVKGCANYLFPELKIKHGVYDWTWFNRSVRQAISEDAEKSFSSLRYGVSSQLILTGLANPDYQYVIGIADETETDAERHMPSVARLKSAIDKIDYPGVNFDRLKLY